MKFAFKAEIEFEAPDAAEAMHRIAKHCIGVANAFKGAINSPDESWFKGKMTLGPVEDTRWQEGTPPEQPKNKKWREE